MLEKVNQMIVLLAFYRPLLTEKQRLFMELHYEQDLSLAEIAKQFDISRQAVHDHIRRTEMILQDYEAKLQLVSKYDREQKQLEKVLEGIDYLEEDCRMNDWEKAAGNIEKVKAMLLELKRSIEG